MTQRPKDIGTAGETAVVRYLRTAGWPSAERRALRGIADAGDIAGTPGITWSVKAGKAAENASDLDVIRWMAELRTQRANSGDPLGVMVLKRKAYSPARAGCWWAVMTASQVGWLCHLAHYRDDRPATGMAYPTQAYTAPARVTLEAACELLRHAGFGSTVEAAA